MLFVTDRQTVVTLDSELTAETSRSDVPLSVACGAGDTRDAAQDQMLGRYGYLFERANGSSPDPRNSDALDVLAAAMEQDFTRKPSEIAPVFSFFAQFVENDLSAPVDMIAGLSDIESLVPDPLPRRSAAAGSRNMRKGKLHLDCVYGDPLHDGEVSQRFRSALMSPDNPAKLRIGELSTSALGQIPMPETSDAKHRDLPRLGAVLCDPNTPLSRSHLEHLSQGLADVLCGAGTACQAQRAVIADLRNDANLPLAQFHLVWLRLHNRFVDQLARDMPGASPASLFIWARQRLKWHYQWLVLNALLPAVCDRDVLAQVLRRGPVLYQKLAATSNDMPLPLEFCAAAFRFGELTMRESYNWNQFYGNGSSDDPCGEVSLDVLLRMTGNGSTPMSPSQELASAPSLPAHWPIEWDRFVHEIGLNNRHHAARCIGPSLGRTVQITTQTKLSPSSALDGMARAELRRGVRMNLPSGQDCIALLREEHGIELPELCGLEICSGRTGDAVREGRFEDQTPLWFYILKEAEVLGRGGRLGPLGTQIVADTMLGIIASDPDSYWHVPGRLGRWDPQDGMVIDGVVIDTMPALMQAAGLLHSEVPAPN